jgi:hypothetical protein
LVVEGVDLYRFSSLVRVRNEIECPNEVHSIDVLSGICEWDADTDSEPNALSSFVPNEYQDKFSEDPGR